MENGGKVALLFLSLAGLVVGGWALVKIARAAPPAEEEPPEEEPPEGEEAVITATLRSGYVYWAALADWQRVYTRYPNEWPLDEDVTFVWTIENTGNVGAYFQVYISAPGRWLYLAPGVEVQVFEEVHTPAVPLTPGYSYYNINILAKRLDGERLGAVWTSEEIEATYS